MLPLLCFGMFTLTKLLSGKMPNYQDLYGRTRRRELKNVGSYFKPSRAYNTHSAALGNQAKRHVVLAKKKIIGYRQHYTESHNVWPSANLIEISIDLRATIARWGGNFHVRFAVFFSGEPC